MGKKKTEEAVVPATNKDDDKEEEDTPVVKALKELDEKYCAIETEFEQEVEALRKKYREEKQAPLLAERASKLSDIGGVSDEDQKMGTPACKGFWLQAMQNSDDFAEILEEWDEPVLQYLADIKRSDLNDQLPQKGFKLDFSFKENPYFTNATLSLEVHTDYDPASYKPWKEQECIELKSTEIDWKQGKNVTVEVIQKKTKGGGAKKQKQKGKSKEEARDSFFRHFFRSLKVGDPAPPELAEAMGRGADDDDDDEDGDKNEYLVKMALEQGYEIGHCIAEEVVPYAVRFYTGEAGDADDDDEGSESEDEDDDDDDDDDSEDEPPPTKGKKKPQKKGGAPGPGEKQEECKQQ